MNVAWRVIWFISLFNCASYVYRSYFQINFKFFESLFKICCISLHEGSVSPLQTMCMTRFMNPRNWACKKTFFVLMGFADTRRYANNSMNFAKLWRTFYNLSSQKIICCKQMQVKNSSFRCATGEMAIANLWRTKLDFH